MAEDDSLRDLIIGLLQDKRVAEAASYVQRWRPYRDLSDDDLRDRWVEAFKVWTHTFNHAAMDDFAAELAFRDLALPIHLVEREWEEVRATIRNAVASGDFDEEKANADLTKELVDFVQRRDVPQN